MAFRLVLHAISENVIEYEKIVMKSFKETDETKEFYARTGKYKIYYSWNLNKRLKM